jgi:hypothetical protein
MSDIQSGTSLSWSDTHYLDPRREIEKLRDQLAAHDKPLAFLFGAGTSCASLGRDGLPLIPAVSGLTELVTEKIDALGEKFGLAIAEIRERIWEGFLEADVQREVNIEDVLSEVSLLIQAMSQGDELRGLTRDEMETVEKTIRTTIASVARPDEARIPDVIPQNSLGRWIARINREWPIEVFTTNYDTLIERGMENAEVPVFDGFVGSRRPFFNSSSLVDRDFAPGNSWARLWKIHGSVNWRREGNRYIRGEERDDGELILPSARKYDESRKLPYVAILDNLGRFLVKRQDSLLLIVGYSFGDQHINESIFESLRVHDRVHVIALMYEDLGEDSELVRHCNNHRNLIVYGPRFGVVGGERLEWRLSDPVDRRTAGLLDVPFDSDFSPEMESTSLTGRFRLGDFNWFARFLDQISGTE